MWSCSPTTFSGQYQTPKRRTFGQKASGFRLNDKEKIEESLEFINSFLTAPDEEDPRVLLNGVKNLLEK